MADFDFRTQMQVPDKRLPPEVYQLLAQAIQQKNQQFEQVGQIAGSGAAAGLGAARQHQQQQKINAWLKNQMQAAGPQQKTMNVAGHPNAPIASYDPGTNQATPAMTPGNPQMQQWFGGLMSAPPAIQREALPKIFEQGFKGLSGGSKPQGSYWVNPDDPTQISPTEKPGFIEYKTSQADAGSKVTSSAQGKLRTRAMEDRVKAWNRSIDAKQINEITKAVGFTPKMISSLQNTAVRGQRGLELLSDPQITWQGLHAAGVDFAGIMQGGAPHVGEVVNATFPNWHEQVGKWNTYITGDVPSTVPTEIRLQMQDMLAHVVALDTKFIDASNKFQKTMVGPTLPGGITPTRDRAIKDIQGVMTGGRGAPDDGWSIQQVAP